MPRSSATAASPPGGGRRHADGPVDGRCSVACFTGERPTLRRPQVRHRAPPPAIRRSTPCWPSSTPRRRRRRRSPRTTTSPSASATCRRPPPSPSTAGAARSRWAMSTTCRPRELIETCRSSDVHHRARPAAISDSQLTVDFYAADAATRLRVDAAAKIGPTASRTETDRRAAGRLASTSSSRVARRATACSDDGILAKLTDGDVYVTMTSFSATVDPAALTAQHPTTAGHHRDQASERPPSDVVGPVERAAGRRRWPRRSPPGASPSGRRGRSPARR